MEDNDCSIQVLGGFRDEDVSTNRDTTIAHLEKRKGKGKENVSPCIPRSVSVPVSLLVYIALGPPSAGFCYYSCIGEG